MKKILLILLFPLCLFGQNNNVFFGYYSAAVAAWKPTDIAGCTFWVNADSVKKDVSNYVDTLIDMSGNNNDAIQSTGAYQPLWVDNQLNGEPVIRLDGSNDELYCINNFVLSTVFVVTKFGTSGNFPEYNGLLMANAGPFNGLIMGEGSTTNLYNLGYTVYINGVATFNFSPIDTYKTITTIKVPDWVQPLYIATGNYPNRWWNGDIAEIIIYDSALSSGDRGLVENYLMTKYALP